MHSTFSHDGHGTLDEMCRAALARGLSEICLTEHIDFDPEDENHGHFQYGDYAAAMAEAQGRYAGRLVIRMGLEMDFRREYGAAFGEGLAGKNVDFVLGSVHSAAGRRIYRLGDAGKADINLADLQAAYFDEVEALVATGLCHAIGHFDYVYKQLPALAALRRDAGYWRRVERILAMCIERGTAVEINTRRTEDGSRGMAVDLEILRRYHALGGRRVTVGADAHRPTEVAHGFAEAEGMLREVGFTAVTGYRAGEPYEVPLNA